MEYLALAVAVFIGGLVSGFAGFAFSAAAGAILHHILEPMQAIPLMMLCSIASQMTSLTMLRKHVVWKDICPLLVGGALGIPIALHLLTQSQPTVFRVAFGIFLVSYALYLLTRRSPGVTGDVGGPAGDLRRPDGSLSGSHPSA